jgi:hypothetical protein
MPRSQLAHIEQIEAKLAKLGERRRRGAQQEGGNVNVLDNPLNPINKYSSDVPFAPLGEGSRGRNGGDKTVPSEQKMNEEIEWLNM